MTNRIYYFGLLGDLRKQPVGGGQTSARRVIQGFKDSGFDVIATSRHWNTSLSRIGHIFETGFFCLLNVTQLFLKLLFGKRKDSIYLNISYSNVLIPLEYYTCKMSYRLGFISLSPSTSIKERISRFFLNILLRLPDKLRITSSKRPPFKYNTDL